MDVKLINPFLSAAVNVLKVMAFTDARAGKPYLKNDRKASGDVTGITGFSGDVEGSLSITFSADCIKGIISNMFGDHVEEINQEVEDAVGEITNMICGDARRQLSENGGYKLTATIPTVISGLRHTVKHISDGPFLAIPFETDAGSFAVEVCFKQ